MAQFPPRALYRGDQSTAREQSCWCGPGAALQEPCSVRRHADAAEGDGRLVALIFDHVRNHPDRCIFDSLNVAAGPLARAKLPIRPRQVRHGNWAEAGKRAA